MMFKQLYRILMLCICLIGAIAPRAVYADFAFVISVDTAPLAGQSGYLDFQFNPGGSGALAATATLTNVQTDGVLASSNILTGDATGFLPGTLVLNNSTVYNDAFQGFTFGSFFNIDITLSGSAINNPQGIVGSSFALSLYAADQITPLLTTDPNGSVATLLLNANGTITPETFSQSDSDPTPGATITPLGVPEPSSALLMILALPFVLLGLHAHTIRCKHGIA